MSERVLPRKIAAPTRLVAALALAAAGGACGGLNALRDPGEVEPETTLEVINHNTLAMNIYVARDGGAWQRLGTAQSLRTTWFEIPERLVFGVTTLRFQADPIGSTRARLSQEIAVIPGDTVVVEIPSR